MTEDTVSALPDGDEAATSAPSLLAFPDWLEQNQATIKEPLQKYRGYSDYVKQETLAQGKYSDTLVQKLDAKLAGLAVESGDYTPAEGTEPLVGDVLARPKSEELPIQSLFNTAYSAETPEDDPLRGAVSKYEAIRRLQDEGRSTPEELAAAEAEVRQLATPEVMSRAVRKDVKEGRSLAAIVPPADPEGRPTLEINDSLLELRDENGNIDMPALGKTLKMHGTDASLIPGILDRLTRPEGYAKTKVEIERHGEAMSVLDTLARTDNNGFAVFEELGKIANSRERGNTYATEFGVFNLRRAMGEQAKGKSDAELLTLADDFNSMNAMPEIDEANPSAALRTLSTGAVVPPLNLMLNDAAFTKALDAVPAAQRPHIQAQRDYAVESSASDVIRTLADNPDGGDEFVSYLDAQRAEGKKDSQIVKDWVAQGKYSSTRTMIQGIRSSLGEAVMPLVALATGADPDGFAIKAMQGAQIEDANRRAVADLFGKPVGMGYDLTRLVAPVAVDLGVSFLTRGAAVGATAAAKATAGAAVKSMLRTSLSPTTRAGFAAWIRPAVESAARSGIKEAGLKVTGRETVDEVVSMAGRDIVNKIATGTAYATSMATAFNRSALSTYASLSTALANQTNPDGTAKYSPEEVKEIAMTHGLASGTITAAVVGGFSAFGAPGLEAVLKLGGVSNSQFTRGMGRLRKDLAGQPEANALITDIVRKAVTPIWKNAGLTGAASEGAEEGIESFLQTFNEAMATGEKVDILAAAKQAFYEATLGGIMGGTIAGAGAAITSKREPSARVEADIRRERLLEMAAKLESTAPQTAQVFRNYAFQQRALIPQRQQLESDLKAAKTPEAKAEIQKKIDTLNEQSTRSRTDELAPPVTTEEGIPEADVAEGAVPPPSDAGMDREGEGVDEGTPEAGRRRTLGGFTGTPVAQRMRATRETVETEFAELVEETPETFARPPEPVQETPESFIPAEGGESIPGSVQARDANRPEQMTPAQYVERFRDEAEAFGEDTEVTLAQRHKATLESLAREDVESVKEGAVGAQYPLNAEAVETYGAELPEGFVKRGDFYVYSPSPTDSLPEGQVASASSPEATSPLSKKQITEQRIARLESARQNLKDIVDDKELKGKMRVERIANHKRLIDFLSAAAYSGRPLKTIYSNGDLAAFDDGDAPDGFQSIIVLDGLSAGASRVVDDQYAADFTTATDESLALAPTSPAPPVTTPTDTLPGFPMPPRKRSLSSMRDATVDKLSAVETRIARESDPENLRVLEAGKQRLTALLGQIETVMMTEAQEARAQVFKPNGEMYASADPDAVVTIAEAQDVPVVEAVKTKVDLNADIPEDIPTRKEIVRLAKKNEKRTPEDEAALAEFGKKHPNYVRGVLEATRPPVAMGRGDMGVSDRVMEAAGQSDIRVVKMMKEGSPAPTDTLTPGTPITFTATTPPGFAEPTQGTVDRVENGRVFARVGRTVIPGVTVIPDATVANPRDRNQFPGEDYPVPPNVVAIQPRGLNTEPMSDQVFTFPYDGTAEDAAKVGAKAYMEIQERMPEMSQRESIFIASGQDGLTKFRLTMDQFGDKVTVASKKSTTPVISDLLVELPEGYPLDRDTAKLVSTAVVMPGGLLSAMMANPVVADAVKRYADWLGIGTQGMRENDLANITQRELEADSVLAALRGEQITEEASLTLPGRRDLAAERRKELADAVAAAEAEPQAATDPSPGLTFKEITDRRLPVIVKRAAGKVQQLKALGYTKQGEFYVHPDQPADTPRNLPSSTPSAAVTAELNKFGFSEGLTTFLTNVAKRGQKQHRALAKLLLSVGADAVPVDTASLRHTDFAGQFNPSTGRILVNTAKIGPRGAVDTVLHELVHATTYQSLRRPTEAQAKVIARINRVRQTIIKRAKQNNTYDDDIKYATGDIDEFLTHFFTSQRFRDQVSAMTPKSEKNWLQVIADLIADLIAGRTRAQRLEAELRKELTTLITAPRTGLAPSDVVMNLPAYHATPHVVDQFSLNKIGTGEGAQAFGYGLYFAESEKVSGRGGVYDKNFESKTGKPSNIYRVELDVDVNTLLDWDKPMSAQSDGVRKAISRVFEQEERSQQYLNDPSLTPKQALKLSQEALSGVPSDISRLLRGLPNSFLSMQNAGDFYFEMSDRAGKDPARVSMGLKALGIKGIRYLDGESRNRPYKEIKRRFLDALPDDASFDEVTEAIDDGTFNPQQVAFLKALDADDWFGFDYPAQAISAALSDKIGNWEPSPELLTTIDALRTESTYNYVIFDESAIRILDADIRFQPASDARNVARFHQLTESLYNGRDSVTAAEIETWKAENPEKWEELSAMREEVLRAGGWDTEMFHGTNADFTVFEQGGGKLGQGFYFASTESQASEYGDTIMRVFLKEGNLLREGDIYEMGFPDPEVDMGYPFREAVEEAGYTGVEGFEETVVFNSEQIKSADPITAGRRVTPDRWADAASPDIRFQPAARNTDAEYLAAVEAGDMETAQTLVDNAAESAGYRQVVAHQTHKTGIEIFDRTRGGKGVYEWDNIGIWTTGRSTPRLYGPVKMELYGRMENPKRYRDLDAYDKMVREYLSIAYPEAMFELRSDEIESDEFIDKFKQAIKKLAKKAKVGESAYSQKYQQWLTKKFPGAEGFRQYLKDQGYDGIQIDGAFWDGEIQTVRIYLEPEQLKSADPVTYEETEITNADGTVSVRKTPIPLSQRFQSTSPDIRFQGLTEQDFTPASLRDTATGFLPDDVTLDDLTIDFADLADITEGLDPVNAENAVHAAVNHALARRAGEAAIPAPVRDGFDSDEAFDAATAEHAAEVARLTDTYELITRGRLTSEAMFRYRTNPGALQRLVDYLTAAIKAAYARFTARYDTATAVALNRMSRDLARARVGFNHDIEPMAAFDPDAVMFQPSEFATPELDNELEKYITGGWSADPDTRLGQSIGFAKEWAKRYGDLPERLQFPATNGFEGTRAYLSDDGKRVLIMAQDRVAEITDADEFGTKRRIALVLTEEMFHLATFKAAMEKTGGNRDQSLKLIRDTYDSLEEASRSNPRLASAMAVGAAAYNETPAKPEDFDGFLPGEALEFMDDNKLAMAGEFVRQLFQLERIGSTTEINLTKQNVEWVKAAFDYIRESGVSEAMLDEILALSKRQIDNLGIRFQPAAQPASPALTPQERTRLENELLNQGAKVDFLSVLFKDDEWTTASKNKPESENKYIRRIREMFVNTHGKLSVSHAKSEKNMDAAITRIEDMMERLRNNFLEAARREDVDMTLVQIAMGNVDPPLTPDMEKKITDDFIAEVKASEAEIKATYEQEKLTNPEKAKDNYAKAITLANAEADRNRKKAIWIAQGIEAEKRKVQQLEVLIQLERTAPDTAEVVKEIRGSLNQFQRLAKEVNKSNPEILAIIDQTFGIYLVRSFGIHQDPKQIDLMLHSEDPFYKERKDALVNFFMPMAKEEIIRQYRQDPDFMKTLPVGLDEDAVIDTITARFQSQINERALLKFEDFMLARVPSSGPFAEGSTVANEIQRYMKKSNMPQEFLDALMVNEDPIFNAMNTMMSLGRLVFHSRMLNEIHDSGIEAGQFITEAEMASGITYADGKNEMRRVFGVDGTNENIKSHVVGKLTNELMKIAKSQYANGVLDTMPDLDTVRQQAEKAMKDFASAPTVSLADLLPQLGRSADRFATDAFISYDQMPVVVRNNLQPRPGRFSGWQPVFSSNKGNSAFAPLGGLYAEPEYVAAMQATFRVNSKGVGHFSDNFMGQAHRYIVGAAGASLGIITQGNPSFYTRNIAGNTVTGAMSAVTPFHPKKVALAMRTIRKLISTKGEITNEMTELIAGRIVLDAPQIGLIKQLIEDVMENPAAAMEDLTSESARADIKAGKLAKGSKKAAKAFIKRVGKFAEASEAFSKIMVYADFKDILTEANWGSELEIYREASRLTNEVMPARSETPTFVNSFTRSGFGALVSPFLRFRVDIIRCTVNSFKLANEWRQSDNPVLRKHGQIKMAAWFGTVGILTVGLPLIMRTILGFDDEDDRYVRAANPAYNKDASLIYFRQRDENGNVIGLNTMNITYTNPLASFGDPLSRIVNAIISNEPSEIPGIMGRYFVGDVLGENIVAGAVIDTWRNRDSNTGLPIHLEAESDLDKALKKAMHIGKAYTPKIGTQAYKFLQALNREEEDLPWNQPHGVLFATFAPFTNRATTFDDMDKSIFRRIHRDTAELSALTFKATSRAPLNPGDIADMFEKRQQLRIQQGKLLRDFMERSANIRGGGDNMRDVMRNAIAAGNSRKSVNLIANQNVVERIMPPKEQLQKMREIAPERVAEFREWQDQYPTKITLD